MILCMCLALLKVQYTMSSNIGNPEDRPDIDANFPGLNYHPGSDEPDPEPELPKVVGEDATVLNVPKRSTSVNSGSTTASSSARWVLSLSLMLSWFWFNNTHKTFNLDHRHTRDWIQNVV